MDKREKIEKMTTSIIIRSRQLGSSEQMGNEILEFTNKIIKMFDKKNCDDEGWFSIDDKDNFISKTEPVEIKFRSGEIIDYDRDNWPWDEVTHWRFKID